MNIDYRKYPQPGVIDGTISTLHTEMEAHRTEHHLVAVMREAINHLERYRDTLRTAYIMDSNQEKHSRLNDRLPRGER